MLIAPCFDKKLEASREEMKENKQPIDLVLSTEELFVFLNEQNIISGVLDKIRELSSYPLITSEVFISRLTSQVVKTKNLEVEDPLDIISEMKETKNESFSDVVVQNLFSPVIMNVSSFFLNRSYLENGSSNGYLDYIIRKESTRLKSSGLKKSQKKNKNHMEFDLESQNGEIRKFSFVYGFKNIQNVIMQVKGNRCKYTYCEIMACPSGCMNGGGQIRYENDQQKSERLEQLFDRDLSKKFQEHESLVRDFITQLDLGKLATIITTDFLNYKVEAIKETDSIKLNW